MVTDLDGSSFDLLKQDKFNVLLIYADACHVCQEAKPKYEELSNSVNGDLFSFYKAPLNQSIYEFYSQFEEKVPQRTPSFDEDGDPILDAQGNHMSRILRDENGEVVKSAPIQIPKFYVFHPDEASDENPYGLLGKVEGFNIEQLAHILASIEEMVKNGEA